MAAKKKSVRRKPRSKKKSVRKIVRAKEKMAKAPAAVPKPVVKAPRALVTGASGRVGGALIRGLLDKGYAVRALVRNSDSAKKVPGGIEVAFGDITDAASLKGCCEGVDVVFHLAALIDYKASKAKLQAVNSRGTANMVKEAARANVRRFIYASSIAVYGKRKVREVLKETDKLQPTDNYGHSKLAGEGAVKYGNVKFSLMRVGVVYGPGFQEAYFPLLGMLRKGGMPYVGPADNHIPFVHVDDVVRAFILAAKKELAPGEAYNIVGRPVTQKQAFDLACDALGVRHPRLHASPSFMLFVVNVMNFFEKLVGRKPKLIREYIDMIAMNRAFDIDKAQMELSWEPRVGMEEGIHGMVEYYREKRKG